MVCVISGTFRSISWIDDARFPANAWRGVEPQHSGVDGDAVGGVVLVFLQRNLLSQAGFIATRQAR